MQLEHINTMRKSVAMVSRSSDLNDRRLIAVYLFSFSNLHSQLHNIPQGKVLVCNARVIDLRGAPSVRSVPFSLTGILPVSSRRICLCSSTSITHPLPNLNQHRHLDTTVSESVPPGKSSLRPFNWKCILFESSLRSITGTPVGKKALFSLFPPHPFFKRTTTTDKTSLGPCFGPCGRRR